MTAALSVSGYDNSDISSKVTFKLIDADIPVTPSTKISFWSYPLQELGQYASIDVLMTDGTTLSNTSAADYDGVSMKPSAGRGIVGSWTQTKCDIGKWLQGKTIDRIVVTYDKDSLTGDFKTYFDDIVITNGTLGF